MDMATAEKMIGEAVKVVDDPNHAGGRLVGVTSDGWGEIREWVSSERICRAFDAGLEKPKGRVDAYHLSRISPD
jgi:selenophosphate synthase